MGQIIHRGLTFTIPSESDHLPVKAVEAWEEGRSVSFIKALVHPGEWTAYTALDPDIGDLTELATKINELYAGESSASRGSSSNTAGPSKLTSNGSTASPSRPPVPTAIQ